MGHPPARHALHACPPLHLAHPLCTGGWRHPRGPKVCLWHAPRLHVLQRVPDIDLTMFSLARSVELENCSHPSYPLQFFAARLAHVSPSPLLLQDYVLLRLTAFPPTQLSAGYQSLQCRGEQLLPRPHPACGCPALAHAHPSRWGQAGREFRAEVDVASCLRPDRRASASCRGRLLTQALGQLLTQAASSAAYFFF